jgi:hypothetical protein
LSLEPLRRRRDRPPRRAYDLGREDAVIRNEANGIGRCTLPLAQIRQGQSAGRLTLAEGLGVIVIGRVGRNRNHRQALR